MEEAQISPSSVTLSTPLSPSREILSRNTRSTEIQLDSAGLMLDGLSNDFAARRLGQYPEFLGHPYVLLRHLLALC
jgi:hypothetical protein